MSNISSSCTHVTSFPLATVVEYLESSMSKELLCKFPDKSAFGFDYAQSSIWSPLLPRAPIQIPDPDPDTYAIIDISRRLSFAGGTKLLLGNTRKMAAGIKRKFTDTVLRNVGGCTNTRMKKRKSSVGFSPILGPSSFSSSPKAWAKV